MNIPAKCAVNTLLSGATQTTPKWNPLALTAANNPIRSLERSAAAFKSSGRLTDLHL
jgi:hypothetical protein